MNNTSVEITEITNKLLDFLSPGILFIVFGVAVILVIMISTSLIYHWREYASIHHRKLVKAEVVYLWVVSVLTVLSLVFLIIYSII